MLRSSSFCLVTWLQERLLSGRSSTETVIKLVSWTFLAIKILSFQNSTMRTQGADGETAHALAFPLQFVAGSRTTESFLLLPFLFLQFWSIIMKRGALGLSLKAIIFYRQSGGAEPGGGTPAM